MLRTNHREILVAAGGVDENFLGRMIAEGVMFHQSGAGSCPPQNRHDRPSVPEPLRPRINPLHLEYIRIKLILDFRRIEKGGVSTHTIADLAISTKYNRTAIGIYN